MEGAVKIVYSRIFARLRNQVFTSLSVLNQAIKEVLTAYNQQPFKGRSVSRLDLFRELDQPVLQPLPQGAYEIKKYAKAKVYKSSHVWLGEDKHYYSVPFRYIGKKVKIAYTSHTVEIYYNYERIALHTREEGIYRYTSCKDHLPSTHQFITDWHPQKFLKWAADIGPHTATCIKEILERRPHPEQAYKVCMGILSLARKVGRERLEKACERAAYFNSYSYRIIKNILEKGLDAEQWQDKPETPPQLSVFHENIRGKEYYQ